MNILLIAYCIGVNRGSEPGVGWNVARGLALRGHRVTVIATSKYCDENMQAIHKEGLNIRLVTRDFPDSRWTRSHKIWQARIGPTIQKETSQHQYDIIHHITFNQYRGIRDVFYCNLPALIGPIGGAEVIPLPLLRYGNLPPISRVKEIARYIPWDAIPLIRRLRKTTQPFRVLCSNAITAKRLTQGLFRIKQDVDIVPAIALYEEEILERKSPVDHSPYILFDGGLTRPQKGTWLMMGAVNQLWKQNCRIPVRIVGLQNGEETLIRKKASQIGLPQEALQLYGRIPRAEMLHHMRHAKVFLSTVYRDSGAMALLEALAQGTHIVCLDIPSQLWLSSNIASKVKIQSSRDRMEKAIAKALHEQILRPPLNDEWENNRISFLKKHMTWKNRIDLFESIYNSLTNASKITTIP